MLWTLLLPFSSLQPAFTPLYLHVSYLSSLFDQLAIFYWHQRPSLNSFLLPASSPALLICLWVHAALKLGLWLRPDCEHEHGCELVHVHVLGRGHALDH